MKLLALLLALASSSFLFVGCETTSHTPNYGYVADAFDEESVYNLFAEFDRCFNELDDKTIRSLLANRFIYTEAADGSFIRLSKSDYIDLVEDDFKASKYINQQSTINSITFAAQSSTANVVVQEVFDSSLIDKDKRIISLFEYEVGYEDGWIFILSARRTDKQEVSGDVGF